MSIIENMKPELVWKQFDAIRKIPRCSKHEEKIREYLLDFADKHGFDVKTDEVKNVVIKKDAAKGMENKPIVVLQSHMDMVCEKNSDVDFDFSKDPIALKVDGDILTADGTTLGADDGIGIAASLAILEDTSLSLGAIEALFTVDEETGLTGAFALSSDMLDGRILLNLDSEDWGVLTVGCAGGGNSDITLPIKKQSAPSDKEWFKINVSGLRGGHSGVDVNEQRANAVKVLIRILWKISNDYDICVSEIFGGDKHNAIPRESHAILGVSKNDKSDIIALIEKESNAICEEYKPIDPNCSITTTDETIPETILEKSSQKTLIDLMNALPHGVDKMSYDIEGLVETSTNCAKIRIEKDVASIQLSSRSSIMSALHDFRNRIHAIVNLAGGTVIEDEPYPGWKPNLQSNILKLSKEIYTKKYGKEPVVEAIHAGLECGIIGEKFDGMDAISIGPTVKYPHSPEEQVHISTVSKFYDFVVEIIKSV
ncbi:MAG: cytosol nonspecific dipeptidase [Thermoplasmata archaeon]|nr:MAG: cytosol nonspecific dipeptidase [Thermoplasmata archaeon]